jgi:hypothetical protein
MTWIEQNSVELILGISSSVFLVNYFTLQDEGRYTITIPLMVFGVVLLYKRHFAKPVETTQKHCTHHAICARPFMSEENELEDGEDELFDDAKANILKIL